MARRRIDQAQKAMADRRSILRAGSDLRGRRRGERPYFAGQEPWALKKSDPERMETVLYTTAETIRRIGILCQPFIPGSAAKLLDLLAVPEDKLRTFANIGAADARARDGAARAQAGQQHRAVEQADEG